MSRAEHPLIAVNGLLSLDKEPALRLANRYAAAVLKAGGVPVAVPPVGGPADLERLLDRVDGIVFSGGDDFDMERLGRGATHPAADVTPADKQDFDFALARLVNARPIPTLAICYGMQLLALEGGGTLHQHLPDDRPGCQEHTNSAVHDVRIEADSKLARVVGVERLAVVSRHHQALAAAPETWRVVAHDEEGLIEAIERPDHPYALGVQWHPELAPEGDPNDRLFRGLVGAAGMSAARAFHPVS